jgi:hypothetical protein
MSGQEEFMAVRFTGHTGFMLLAIWLILAGLGGLVGLTLPFPVMALLELFAGVLILIGR